MSSRNILRGTFRVSIVLAVLAAGASLYMGWQERVRSENMMMEWLRALECAARLPDEELKAAFQGAGALDIRKVGCSTVEGSATLDTLHRAREGALRREFLSYYARPKIRMDVEGANAATFALICFVAVNLLGLAFLLVRGVFRWVANGFKPST